MKLNRVQSSGYYVPGIFCFLEALLVTFVIGGARSGKSSFALKEGSALVGKKAYVATAEALDAEMKARIEKHREERSEEWITFEEPLNISQLIDDLQKDFDVIIIDCLTVWLSNLMMDKRDIDETMGTFSHSLSAANCSLFIVSNELGMGIVPDNELARRFRDVAGAMNQKLAGLADNVYLVTAGIPIKIK